MLFKSFTWYILYIGHMVKQRLIWWLDRSQCDIKKQIHLAELTVGLFCQQNHWTCYGRVRSRGWVGWGGVRCAWGLGWGGGVGGGSLWFYLCLESDKTFKQQTLMLSFAWFNTTKAPLNKWNWWGQGQTPLSFLEYNIMTKDNVKLNGSHKGAPHALDWSLWKSLRYPWDENDNFIMVVTFAMT